LPEQDVRKTLEKLALITASPIRTAIVSGLVINRTEPYSELKKTIEESLKAEISDGSLSWHLQKLMAAGIIEKAPEGAIPVQEGQTVFKGRKVIFKTRPVDQSREGYHLTIEGNDIKQAVIAAVNRITMPPK